MPKDQIYKMLPIIQLKLKNISDDTIMKYCYKNHNNSIKKNWPIPESWEDVSIDYYNKNMLI